MVFWSCFSCTKPWFIPQTRNRVSYHVFKMGRFCDFCPISLFFSQNCENWVILRCPKMYENLIAPINQCDGHAEALPMKLLRENYYSRTTAKTFFWHFRKPPYSIAVTLLNKTLTPVRWLML